jgi:type IV secretory pathway protease TraF
MGQQEHNRCAKRGTGMACACSPVVIPFTSGALVFIVSPARVPRAREKRGLVPIFGALLTFF